MCRAQVVWLFEPFSLGLRSVVSNTSTSFFLMYNGYTHTIRNMNDDSHTHTHWVHVHFIKATHICSIWTSTISVFADYSIPTKNGKHHFMWCASRFFRSLSRSFSLFRSFLLPFFLSFPLSGRWLTQFATIFYHIDRWFFPFFFETRTLFDKM